MNKEELQNKMGNLSGINMSGNVASQIAAIQAEAISDFVKSAKITIPKGTILVLDEKSLPLGADLIINNCLS